MITDSLLGPRGDALTPAGGGRSDRPIPAHALLVCIAYYAGAELGFALTFPHSPVSTLWAPNAIVLAAFLLTPVRAWWLVLAGALPAHLLVELRAGVPALMVVSWFISNATEALIGAVGVRRFVRRPVRLDRVATVGMFVLFAGFLAPLLSSFLDAAFVKVNGWGENDYWTVWGNRFFSNVFATLTIVPVILAWSAGGIASLRAVPLRRYVEAGLLVLGLLAVSVTIFGRQAGAPGSMPALLYAPLPFLLWATVRFGPAGVSTCLLMVVLISIWGAVHGRGPFVTRSAEANALAIQTLFIVIATTLLMLAAVIDERRRAQETAKRQGEQLRLALDAAQMGTWDWHIGRDSAEWSDEGRRILGLGDGGAAGSLGGFIAGIHPSDRASVRRAIDDAIGRVEPYEAEFRVIKPDGSIRWVVGKGKVLRDVAERPIRVIGLHADITERRSAEALSEGANAILKLIATGAPLGEILRSLAVFVEAESPGMFCSILLLDADGVHARHGAAPSLPPEYVHAIDGEAIGPNAGSCGTAMYLKKPVITSDIREDPLWNDYRSLALRHRLRACWSNPILSQTGAVLGSFAMYYQRPRKPGAAELKLIDSATQLACIAIERQRAELEAHDQRRELAHLGRVVMLGQLSGALAHELRQPLTAILSDAQSAQRLLARTPPDLSEIRDILSDIVEADLRASGVIQGLRAMLMKGKADLAPLDLTDVTSEVLWFARTDVAAREVSVDTDLAQQLPPVRGDRTQLQQVLLNLIMNGCDAMSANPPSERHLRIVTRRSDNASVEVSIADRGTGIPGHLLETVFDPFFTSKENGLGLGLSICRSIVVAHRGRLWAVNNPDRGATFHLVLPDVTAERELRPTHLRSGRLARGLKRS